MENVFNAQTTVVLCGCEYKPPTYVIETLSLGPNNLVLE